MKVGTAKARYVDNKIGMKFQNESKGQENMQVASCEISKYGWRNAKLQVGDIDQFLVPR